MNLRILKKLSKKAAPFLPLLGDGREQFRAEKNDNYIGLCTSGFDRKHWERMRSVHNDIIGEEIKKPAADGRGWISIRPPCYPLKGTVMVGATSGYYEPEWEEEDAWGALIRTVADHFTEYDDSAEEICCTRDLSTIALVFAAANDAFKNSANQSQD